MMAANGRSVSRDRRTEPNNKEPIMRLKNLLTNTLLPALLALVTACDGGDDGEETPDISGRWLSACMPSPQADGSTQSIRLDFALTQSDWTLDYVTHGDDACTVPVVTVAIAGPYTLEQESAEVEGAWEARFGFTSKTIRPEVDGLRDYLNSLEGCGSAEFVTGEAQDVYASGCPAFGQYPRSSCEADFDLVKLDGDALYFGARPADNDMCTPEKRPTTIGPAANLRQ